MLNVSLDPRSNGRPLKWEHEKLRFAFKKITVAAMQIIWAGQMYRLMVTYHVTSFLQAHLYFDT